MRVALHLHELHDFDRARSAHPAEIVAAEVHEHQVLGALLLVGEEALDEVGILFRSRAAWPRAGDGVHPAPAVVDRHQRLRRGADDVESNATVRGTWHAQQVHIGTRIGHSQHAVHVERRSGAGSIEPLGQHHLEGISGANELLDVIHGREVVGTRCARVHHAPGLGVIRRHRGRRRSLQITRHRIDALNRVMPCLVHAVVRRVVVDGIRDQQDGAVGVVQHRQVSGEQEAHLGNPDLVGVAIGQALPPAHRVVGHVADHATGQRRKSVRRIGPEQGDRVAQHLHRIARARNVDGWFAVPLSRAITLGQQSATADAHEAVARV